MFIDGSQQFAAAKRLTVRRFAASGFDFSEPVTNDTQREKIFDLNAYV
jgi:hypothetical protein